MKKHQTTKYRKRHNKGRANRAAKQAKQKEQIYRSLHKDEPTSPARRAFQDV